MKLIDSFLFFNEFDLLKIRLNLLYEKVNYFVICESNITFSGLQKPFYFLENSHEFTPWLDKIIHLKYEPNISDLDFSIKDISLNFSLAPWRVEEGQRNYLSTYISSLANDDMVIVSDVDEIWNPDLSSMMRQCGANFISRLDMKFHYYYVNCMGVGPKNSNWTAPFVANAAYLKANQNLDQIRKKAKLDIISDGGWHFSYLGGAKCISKKIHSFSHQEINTAEINNLPYLERCIYLGIDYLKRPGHEWAFRPIHWYPDELVSELKKFPHLVRESLM